MWAQGRPPHAATRQRRYNSSCVLPLLDVVPKSVLLSCQSPPRQPFRLNVWNTFQPHTSHLADRLTGSAKSDPVLPGSRTRTSPLQPLHFINIDITHHQSPITQHAHSRPLQEQGRKGPAPRCCPSVAQSQLHSNVKKLSVEGRRAYSVTLPADVPQPTCDTVQHACR